MHNDEITICPASRHNSNKSLRLRQNWLRFANPSTGPPISGCANQLPAMQPRRPLHPGFVFRIVPCPVSLHKSAQSRTSPPPRPFRKSNKGKSVMRNWVRFVKDVRGSHSHLSPLPKICLRHTAMHPLPVDRRFWSSFLIVLRTCTGWFATGNGRVISRTSGSRTYTRSMPEKKDSRKKDWTEP